MVGNADSTTNSNDDKEQRSSSSCFGPGISVWAPGTNIMSTTSTTNEFNDGSYPGDSNFKICNISGTSMASPQVCGVGALILQANPGISTSVLKSALKNQAGSAVWDGGNNNYDNNRSIQGAPAEVLFNKFGKVENCIEYSGTLDIPLTITF